MSLITRFAFDNHKQHIKRRISAVKNHIIKASQIMTEAHLQLYKNSKANDNYYNVCHVSQASLKLKNFVKLSTKNLKLKYQKLSFIEIKTVQSA
jgi:hypothetical protein